MKTLIALDDQEELIDKFEGAMDGINSDMALAEKALKVRFYIENKLDNKYEGINFQYILQSVLAATPREASMRSFVVKENQIGSAISEIRETQTDRQTGLLLFLLKD